MSDQNYANHGRLVFAFHRVGFALLLTALVLSGRYVWRSFGTPDLELSLLLLTMVISLFLIAFFARSFAIKAQDRIIRTEENFRHYRRHGTLLPENLTLRQIIGLRFAPDDEFDELAAEAGKNGTSEDDIKKSIKNWKADEERV